MNRIDDLPERSVHYAREQFDTLVTDTENYVREKPAQSLMYAFLAGFVIHRLPMARLLGGMVRLALFALKPLVLLYGATKLYRVLQEEKELPSS
jgi:hypothetical protein